MTFYGAEPASLRQLAAQFDRAANNLEATLKPLQSQINNHRVWQGPDADRFRSEWTSVSRPRTTSAVDALRQAADTLRRNADEQEKTSSVDAAPVGAAQLFRHIENDQTLDNGTKTGDKDGVRIEKVVAPDGETRLIVYLKGQGSVDSRDNSRDVLLLNHWVDPAVEAEIDEALADCPNGKNTDIMLVGYSQGGMDAQNIAASGGYHVTNMVTYGSPIIHNDIPTIDTVHLRGQGDPIPTVGAYVGGTLLTDGVNHHSNAVFESDPNVGLFGDVHGSGYPNVAQDFEDSDDPRFAHAKEAMKRFQGTIISTEE